MDSKGTKPTQDLARPLSFSPSPTKILPIIVVVALIAGVATGYFLSSSSGGGGAASIVSTAPKAPEQDTKTFRDFAEGTIQKKPSPPPGEDYSEGTHLLIRQGAVPVALTSSVVDLSQYEGKKVKVYGETQKAIKEGWLMDVGRVEIQK